MKTVLWTHDFLRLHLLEVKGKYSRDPYPHFMDEAIASHDVGVLPAISGLVSGSDRKGLHPGFLVQSPSALPRTAGIG